jgi:hypothetical protein
MPDPHIYLLQNCSSGTSNLTQHLVERCVRRKAKQTLLAYRIAPKWDVLIFFQRCVGRGRGRGTGSLITRPVVSVGSGVDAASDVRTRSSNSDVARRVG